MNYLSRVDRHQLGFLTSLDDLIPPGHSVRLLDAFIDQIVQDNRERFYTAPPGGPGRPAYPPECMLKLFLYGYAIGVKSSRRLETEAKRNIEAIWLMHRLQPDCKTISEFRRHSGEQIQFVADQMSRFLKANGYIGGKAVAIDGTKVKAYTSDAMLTREMLEHRMARAHKEVERYLDQLMQSDQDEDQDEDQGDENRGGEHRGGEHRGDEHRGDEADGPLLEALAGQQAQIAELERLLALHQEQGACALSASDPEARLMRTRKGKGAAYNVQFAVDEQHHLIVTAEVTNAQADQQQLQPMHERVSEVLGEAPEELLADTGYADLGDIQRIERETPTRCFIPENDRHKQKEAIQFRYDPRTDRYICTAGSELVPKRKGVYRKGEGAFMDVYEGIACQGCALQALCTSAKNGIRQLKVFHGALWREQYRKRIRSRYGRGRVKRRKAVVEHVIGTIKYWMGQIPLVLRGKSKVQTEINLYTTGYNLKRLASITPMSELIEQVKGFKWQWG